MTNYDFETGIHYGVISPHSVSQEVLDDIIDKSTNTIYEESKKEFLAQLRAVLTESPLSTADTDEILDIASDRFGENYENDYHEYEYEDKEYHLHICDDNFGIFVIKSPFYTYCRQCSPCAPNAGNLDSPVHLSEIEREENVEEYGKTYCLPNDFFEDNTAPYSYYRVSDDKEVIEPIIEA